MNAPTGRTFQMLRWIVVLAVALALIGRFVLMRPAAPRAGGPSGAPVGAASEQAYLRLAQTLRDRPAGGDVLELVRADGVTCRFDRASGLFGAFDADGTIRTLFRPNAGESYFRRQAGRTAEAP